jgi:uncharacterized Ntn-hydrolase superfamily protein
MTFTILAHDPEADQVGIGIATVSLAVGGLCPFTTLAGDIVTSQAFARPAGRPPAERRCRHARD